MIASLTKQGTQEERQAKGVGGWRMGKMMIFKHSAFEVKRILDILHLRCLDTEMSDRQCSYKQEMIGEQLK